MVQQCTVSDVPVGPMAPDRRLQAVELAVYLFLILPSLVLSLFAVGHSGTRASFALAGSAVILRDAALVALVWYFLWRNGEPLGKIGWAVRHPGRETAWGLVLFGPMFLAAGGVDQLARAAGLSPGPKALPPELLPRGPAELLLAVVMVLVVAWAEETIFRGYLILRLRAVTPGAAVAVAVSSAVFAIGHGYEGSAGVVTVGFMGVVFALVYLWRKSLVAPMVMHFLQDFLGIVILPLLVRGRP